MNEAKCLMKNYGDLGGCYPPRPTASTDNTLLNLHNSSYDTKAEFNNFFLLFIQNNSQFRNKKTCLPPSMLSSLSTVHVQGCSAPQIFSNQQMSPFELCSCCSCYVFSYYFTQFLPLKRVKCPPVLFSQSKQLNLIPRSSRLTVH